MKIYYNIVNHRGINDLCPTIAILSYLFLEDYFVTGIDRRNRISILEDNKVWKYLWITDEEKLADKKQIKKIIKNSDNDQSFKKQPGNDVARK